MKFLHTSLYTKIVYIPKKTCCILSFKSVEYIIFNLEWNLNLNLDVSLDRLGPRLKATFFLSRPFHNFHYRKRSSLVAQTHTHRETKPRQSKKPFSKIMQIYPGRGRAASLHAGRANPFRVRWPPQGFSSRGPLSRKAERRWLLCPS